MPVLSEKSRPGSKVVVRRMRRRRNSLSRGRRWRNRKRRGAGRALSYLPFNDAARIQQIDPSLFLEGAEIDLRGCKAGQGENSFAQALANHLGRNVLGSQVGTRFSGVKNGRPNEGLPKNVPANFQPVYMVPDIPGKGFRIYEPQK